MRTYTHTNTHTSETSAMVHRHSKLCTHTHAHTQTHTHTLTLTHTHTRTPKHALNVYNGASTLQIVYTHTHTPTLSLALSLSHTRTHLKRLQWFVDTQNCASGPFGRFFRKHLCRCIHVYVCVHANTYIIRLLPLHRWWRVHLIWNFLESALLYEPSPSVHEPLGSCIDTLSVIHFELALLYELVLQSGKDP